MSRYSVLADWEAAYDDPITLDEGEALWLSGRTDTWDGHVWLWARNGAGREGWIPDALVRRAAGRVFATAAYSARELTCRAGETLDAVEATHGWVRCRAAGGLEGWVPARNLREIEEG